VGDVVSPRPPLDAPVALYRLYDDHVNLLYIGITGSLRRRFREHAKDKPWWGDVAAVRVEWHRGDRAERIERAAVTAEAPRYNQNGDPEETRTPPGYPPGVPLPPAGYSHWEPEFRVRYHHEWHLWRAMYRDAELNPEERRALGRTVPPIPRPSRDWRRPR
jgi:hypothetical protein